MKPLVITLSGNGEGEAGGDGRSDLTNEQRKAIQNCHTNLQYNEYMLIKMEEKSIKEEKLLKKNAYMILCT
jgi:hypothetical protein